MRQQLPGFDGLPFAKCDRHQLSVDPGTDDHHVARHNGAKRRDIDLDAPFAGGSGDDRHRARVRIASALGLGLLFRALAEPKPCPGCQHSDAEKDAGDPRPTTLAWQRSG